MGGLEGGGGVGRFMYFPGEDTYDDSNLSNSSGLTIEKYFLNSCFFLALAFLVLTVISFTRFILIFVYLFFKKSYDRN